MLRMLLTTTALVALTGAAHAESHVTAATDDTMTSMSTFEGDFMPYPPKDAWFAEDITGMTVYASSARDESIGEIEDIIVSPEGRVEAAIIGIGGFLEIGEKDVAVSWDSLAFESRDTDDDGVADDHFVVYTASRESLDAAPEFDRDFHMEMAARDSMADTPVSAPTATSVDSPMMVELDRESLPLVGFADMRADDLLGQRVYSYENEDIGEVGDLILTDDGQIDAVIVDFGGFLGLGEKEVAVGFESVEVRKDEAGNLMYVYTNLVREDLEAAPAYDEANYRERRDEFRTIAPRS